MIYCIQEKGDKYVLKSIVNKDVYFMGKYEQKAFVNFVAEGSLEYITNIKKELENENLQ